MSKMRFLFFFSFSRNFIFNFNNNYRLYFFIKKKEKFAEVNRVNIVYVKLLLNLINRIVTLFYRMFFPPIIFF